jgi:Hypothetical protein (DUF2513)
MRRDMELIRKMVLLVEDHLDGNAPDIKIDGYTASQIGYHSYLLVSGGLAVGDCMTDSGDTGPNYSIRYLTPAGHDFAESVRNQYIWDEVWNEIQDKGLGSATIDVVNKMADKYLRKRLDLV